MQSCRNRIGNGCKLHSTRTISLSVSPVSRDSKSRHRHQLAFRAASHDVCDFSLISHAKHNSFWVWAEENGPTQVHISGIDERARCPISKKGVSLPSISLNERFVYASYVVYGSA